METTRNKGLEALIRVAGYGGKEISSYAAAFGLAPRVNAAGRLGSADRAVRLFTTDNVLLAEAIARELNEENRLRQNENEIFGRLSLMSRPTRPVKRRCWSFASRDGTTGYRHRFQRSQSATTGPAS